MKLGFSKKILYRIIVVVCSLNLAVWFVTGEPVRILTATATVISPPLGCKLKPGPILEVGKPLPPPDPYCDKLLFASSSKAIEQVPENIILIGDSLIPKLSVLIVVIAALLFLKKAIVAGRRRYKNKRKLATLPKTFEP